MAMGVIKEKRMDWSYRRGINSKPGREATAWEWPVARCALFPQTCHTLSKQECHSCQLDLGAEGGKAGRTVSSTHMAQAGGGSFSL